MRLCRLFRKWFAGQPRLYRLVMYGPYKVVWGGSDLIGKF